MVRWPGVMWHRVTLTLLLASMASSGGSACPEACQCGRITSREPPINRDGNGTTEIRCTGETPTMESLPREIPGRLVVERSAPYALQKMLLDLETKWYSNNTQNKSLEELAIIGCSLKRLNVTLSRVTKGLLITSLNLSYNQFTEIGDLRIEGDSQDRLERLDLSNNLLSRVRSETFANLPRLVQLTLRRNKIHAVEKNAFASLGILESLDLSDNNLANLVGDAFAPLYFLQKLDVSGNELRALDGQWFASLGRLRELDVSRNKLARSQVSTVATVNQSTSVKNDKSNDSGALQALPFGLTVLRLADNPLMELELSLVLGSGRRLETVDASRIGLERVPPALTRSVRALTLAGNKLSTIRSGDFDSYPLLRLLDLSNNSLRVVEEDALGRLEVLENLDLSRNKLTELPQSLPSSLVHLVVRHNFIGRLSAKDLQGLCKLERLYLDNNAIIEIEEGSMNQLTLLTELDVSDNPLKQLPANTFGGPRSLVVLRLSGLVSLEWEREKRADMAFPVPAPERLVSLDLSRSPALAAQLLADEAALSACKSLRRLNLAQTNLTTLRSDLAYLLPQLHTLGLAGNYWDCTSANSDVYWLAEWLKQHEEIQPPAKCAEPFVTMVAKKYKINTIIALTELPNYRTPSTPTAKTLSISNSMENLVISHTSKSNDKNDKTATERVKLRSVPNKSQSYTIEVNSIKTVANSLDIESNKIVGEIESSTKIIESSPTIVGVNKKNGNDVLPELSTSRIAKNIVVYGDKSGDLPNYIDDDNEATVKIDTIGAQELIGSEETSKYASQISQMDFIVRAHPGMLVVFAGAALGIFATISVVLSRRLTTTTTRGQSNVLSSQEQQPIITELW